MNDLIDVAKALVENPSSRIPREFRTDAARARELIDALQMLGGAQRHRDGMTLAEWCNHPVSRSNGPARIASIEHLGQQQTYDITVPGPHSFAMGGVFAHNCNLPKSVSHDVVSRVYLEAWRSGCKGFTVYRDGSRDGVLVSDASVTYNMKTRLDGIPDAELLKTLEIGKKYEASMPPGHLSYLKDVEKALLDRAQAPAGPEEALRELHSLVSKDQQLHAPKRPKELPCEIHRVTVRGKSDSGEAVSETYVVLVGLLDGKPYEIFCGLSEHVEVPRKYKNGVLVKNGKKLGVATYNLRIPVGSDDEAIVLKDVVNLFDNPVNGAFTRILSLALRHAIPLQFVVEQLQKDKHSDMQSFSRVMARVLKGYIADGTAISGEKKCEGCGAEGTLIYEEGCVKCTACPFSKCG